MRPQLQRHRTRAEGVYGDCYRTCLAMVLDLDRDDVPHFCEDVPPGTPADDPRHVESLRLEDEWLAARGLARVHVPYSPELTMAGLAEQYARIAGPSVAVIMGCSLGGGMDHVVVLHQGVVYDPLGVVDPELYRPCIDGMWWATILAAATQPLPPLADPATVATQED